MTELSRRATEALLLLAILITSTRADIVSSSTIDVCSNSIVDEVSKLNCVKKLAISLSINNLSNKTNVIEAYIQSSKDANNASSTLQSPIKITIKKTPISLVYPLVYIQTVNGKPFEKIILRGWTFSPPKCKDGNSEVSTCGWYYTVNGNRISQSNGFCCSCSYLDVFYSSGVNRGPLDCNPFGYKFSSAHCLRFSETWWDVYEIEPSRLFYEIEIEVTGAGNTTTEPYRLHLNHSRPFFVNEDATLSAKIVGDFYPWTTYPVFSDSSYLCMPSHPLDSERVMQMERNWMILSKSMFDLSGRTCDKIGVSFSAFTSQPNRCTSPASSCLHNQLDDIFEAEDKLRSQNMTPNYLLSRWGSPVNVSTKDPSHYFALHVDEIQNTLVTLYIKADNIRYIVNKSTGKIVSASAENFSAFSKQGQLKVSVMNTGQLNSDYYISVQKCTGGIIDPNAILVPIYPYWVYKAKFDLYSQNTINSSSSCTVSLYSSDYELLDQMVVSFEVAEKSRFSQLPIYSNEANNVSVSSEMPSCREMCSGIWNFYCLFKYGCYWSIFYTTLLTILGIGIVCLVVRCCCPCCFCFRCGCFGWCGKLLFRLLCLRGGHRKKRKARHPARMHKSKKESLKTIDRTERFKHLFRVVAEEPVAASGKKPDPPQCSDTDIPKEESPLKETSLCYDVETPHIFYTRELQHLPSLDVSADLFQPPVAGSSSKKHTESDLLLVTKTDITPSMYNVSLCPAERNIALQCSAAEPSNLDGVQTSTPLNASLLSELAHHESSAYLNVTSARICKKFSSHPVTVPFSIFGRANVMFLQKAATTLVYQFLIDPEYPYQTYEVDDEGKWVRISQFDKLSLLDPSVVECIMDSSLALRALSKKPAYQVINM